MRNFKELLIWKRAYDLTLGIYQITMGFPKEEKFGLTGQIRRSSASIPANIAEGCGRSGDPDFARFLQIALGSTYETECHLMLAHDLGYLSDSNYSRVALEITELEKMLTSFIQRIQRK